MDDTNKIIPQIKCSLCQGTEFIKAGHNDTRLVSKNPRKVIGVQRWTCKNPQCRKFNFTQMDGTPLPHKLLENTKENIQTE
jgi:transposase-like protein